MIPVKLTLRGLYSYRESQTIDFETLTASQLFGIFGAVGGGKSSILEAIMFVLFDRSDRLNQKDNRYYNMLNLQSNEMEIDFIFRAETNSESTYRFYFRAGRNRNNYEQVVLRDRNYYKGNSGEWQPIAVKDASELLGMNYDNFMQTVIIPQGKFREFVDQGATQRTQMLKELFNLNQYELGGKVKVLSQKNKTDLTEVQARLSEIGGISQEEIENEKEKVAQLEKGRGEKQSKADALEKDCQAQEALCKLFESIVATEKEQQTLEAQQKQIEQREKQLNDYNRAYTYFKERLQRKVDIGHEISSLTQKRKVLLEEIEQQKQQLLSAKEELQKRQQDYEQRETDILKCQDLEYVIKIREYQLEQEKNQHTLKASQQKVEQLTRTLEESKKLLSEEEESLAEFDKKLRFRATLNDIHHWHVQHKRWQQEHTSCEDQQKQYLSHIEKLSTQQKQRLSDFEWLKETTDLEVVKTKIRSRIQEIRSRQQQEQTILQNLQVKEKLSAYANNLEEGKACPLCGSEHHPQIVHTTSVHQELEQQQSLMQKLQEEENQIRQLADEVATMDSDMRTTQALLEKTKSELEKVKQNIKAHHQQFAWEDFASYNDAQIRGFISKLDKLGKKAEVLRKVVQDKKKNIPLQEQSLKVAQEVLQQQQQNEHALQTSINNLLGLLKVYEYEGWKNHALSELKESLHRGKRKVEEADEQYKKATKHYNECEKNLHGSQSREETEKERLEQEKQKLAKVEEELEALCHQKNFESLEEVRNLLSLKLNVEEEQKAIQQYHTQINSIKDQLSKLKREAEGKHYDKQKHEAILREWQQQKAELQKCQERIAVAREQLKQMEERLQNSRQLQEKLEKLRVREDNLKELASLFKGSGFVRYVSSVYLDNLCRTANERFMKLTRNSLSLELNAEGEFIVRDFLNNGKTRLLKTLSGGQTFQAALCLALALAENVKTLNQAEQSFFFLDEGFGSLDKESLRLVFDTLKSLRKEQRIVGIISHVEELQQEIDVYLKVQNDKERGSLISCSWKS
ncbi:SMC family ATPase [Porifericola rhodea]|uniref:AAA family ATPase n=1 Tax=Porifericola rhodea TaxID=930972 RepID=UPI00266669FB|nr:SMC family ATPase [Porifericola rhodea]WKN31699.1 SMC family ATPase [Porifericola rhodea]